MHKKSFIQKIRLVIGIGLALMFFTKSFAQDTYFQQQVSYAIDVELNPSKQLLSGKLQLKYTHHGSEPISFIWMHLWPNAYKDNATAYALQKAKNERDPFLFSKGKYRGWIDSLQFTLKGAPLKIEAHPEHIDIVKLILPEPLKQGESIEIETIRGI